MTEAASCDFDRSNTNSFPSNAARFRCGEDLDENGDLFFHCCLQDGEEMYDFAFSTRERSVGVLLEEETSNDRDIDTLDTEESDEPMMDPFFFDPGYTLAATTGFQIWAGTRMLVDAANVLIHVRPDDTVVELGAGVGVAGTCWAAITGCDVILTDLQTLVVNAVLPNLQRNSGEASDIESWTKVGKGRALPLSLDWSKDITAELKQQDSIDWIIASDCVWLTSMLVNLLNTVQALFELNPNAVFVLSFQKRGNRNDDTMFTTPSSVYKELLRRKWSVESLALRSIRLSDGCNSEVYLWKVAQAS